MTDRELVQSLRQCALPDGDCRKCGQFGNADMDCRSDLMLQAANALDRLHPPLKIGDTAWGIWRCNLGLAVRSGRVRELYYNEAMELCVVVHNVTRGRIGEKVFLTKEEAEKALEKILEGTP